MARSLYLGYNVIIDEFGNAVPNAPFDVYDDAVAGSQITDLTLIDGISAPSTNVGGQFLAGADGIPPHLRGPDGFVGILYRDAGTGKREPMHPDARLDALLQSGAVLDTDQTWTGVQNFDGSVDFAANPTVNGAPLTTGGGTGGGTDLTDYSQVAALPNYPATFTADWGAINNRPTVVAAGTTAANARTVIGFDGAARAAVPYGNMAWDSVTDTWWAYDPTSGSWINGGPRPNCPPGMCTYDARNDPAATLPTGAQAPQKFGNLPGDTFRLHQSSALWPV